MGGGVLASVTVGFVKNVGVGGHVAMANMGRAYGLYFGHTSGQLEVSGRAWIAAKSGSTFVCSRMSLGFSIR